MRDDANIRRGFKLRLVGSLDAQPSAADVTGIWKAKIETPNGSFENTFVLKVEGTKLTRMVKSGQGNEMPIAEGKIDGNEISFVVVQKGFG